MSIDLSYRQLAHALAREDGELSLRGHLGYTNSDGSYEIATREDRNRVHVRVMVKGALSVTSALAACPLLPDYPVVLVPIGDDQYAIPDYERLPAYFNNTNLPMNAVAWHTHEPEYGLMEHVSSIRLRPGLFYVSTGLVLAIQRFFYFKDDNTLGYFADTTLDLSAYLPETPNKKCLALLALDKATGELDVQTGTDQSLLHEFKADEFTAFEINGLDPLMFVILRNGATTLTYQDMIDARIWASNPAAMPPNSGAFNSDDIVVDADGDIVIDSNGNVVVQS